MGPVAGNGVTDPELGPFEAPQPSGGLPCTPPHPDSSRMSSTGCLSCDASQGVCPPPSQKLFVLRFCPLRCPAQGSGTQLSVAAR